MLLWSSDWEKQEAVAKLCADRRGQVGPGHMAAQRIARRRAGCNGNRPAGWKFSCADHARATACGRLPGAPRRTRRVVRCVLPGIWGMWCIARRASRAAWPRWAGVCSMLRQAPCPRQVVGQTHYGIGTHACLPACTIRHSRARIGARTGAAASGRDAYPHIGTGTGSVASSALGRIARAPCCELLGMLRGAAASAAAIDAHSVARASRPVARRALHRVACVSSARTLHWRLSAVLLHARRAPGQHREGRQAEPGPVARHGGCARRAAQRATCNMQLETCNMQHAADNMQLTTCNMQLTTCGIEHATCDAQKAAWIVQLATCAIVGCNGQVSTDATQLSA
jgi:hypothetical protein